MRLLQINSNGDLSLVEYFGNDIPPYAILSHTWGTDDDEISFKDIKKGRARSKASGYRKIRFCGEQALRDGIHFFWVDTCCIKQESSQEVGEAINSMYRWYHDAVTCYVYLADVTVGIVTHEEIASVSEWYLAFQSSRWFTRGWTLQELLAPVSVEFYSKHGYRLGDRTTLVQQIQLSTGIAEAALRGSPLSNFTVEERISWARTRATKREEDAAYSLLGLFGIHMPLIYGEGRRNALKRLRREIVRASREEPFSEMFNPSSIVGPGATNPFLGAPTTHTTPDLQFTFRIDEILFLPDPVWGKPYFTRGEPGISGAWWMCGSLIHRIPELPGWFRHFDTTTVYYRSEKFAVAHGDRTGATGEFDGEWHDLGFFHNDKDFSSSLHIRGTNPTLRCQRSGSSWPRFLLPSGHHGPIDTSQRYGGLRGSLSIFLALLALSVRPNELEAVLPTLRNNGQWCFPAYANRRLENRGVVVYVYCGTAPGSTSEDLQAYENGAYGNFLD
ncbi:heterokaryon incompatibility protein-domain-containing protein [Alternaria rosae]|uniref:heterokaryon incompatibility protein-domain-containing protein n=1 Tax=Alternaria rosae TaxID=1187941 RepID=UPI001E8E888D|nr:heterokaryon incompatibility protein-domain-containing protein [Alternaria rosae]KAH6866606.1 heterokaryon incompatibility protein-domain-containing protein [Alternaria rosae]